MSRLLAALVLVLALAPGQSARADWRDELGTFRVGIVSRDGAAFAAGAEPFRLALEAALSMPVEIVALRDFPALIDASTRSRVEYGIFSAGAYAAAEALCECLEPLVIPRSGDGGDGYFMALVVPAARGGGPEALRGARIAVVRPDSDGGAGRATGGVTVAERELAAAGFDMAAGAAQEIAFADSGAAIAALERGEVDALLGWTSAVGDPAQGYTRGTLAYMKALGVDPAGYRIAWQSSLIPHRVHAVRENIDAQARTALRGLLSAMFDADPLAYDSVEPVHGGGFFAARPSQFDALVAMFREMGLTGDGEQ